MSPRELQLGKAKGQGLQDKVCLDNFTYICLIGSSTRSSIQGKDKAGWKTSRRLGPSVAPDATSG